MAASVITAEPVRTSRSTAPRLTAALFLAGGVLMAVGGGLHPRGSGGTVDEYLLTMFASPQWSLAHVLLMLGYVSGSAAFASAWRSREFGERVQRWLPLVAASWAFGALETVPHLLASREAHALAHHQTTPLLDLHLLMQLVAGPAVGLAGALVAVGTARAAGSRPAWVLAGFAVVGGLLSGAAGPAVVLTDEPQVAVLFACQLGLAVWLAGTGLRLLRR